MLLNGKTAIIFGAGGAIGSAVARAFAREGARVFLSGRNAAPVEAVAKTKSGPAGVSPRRQPDKLVGDRAHLGELLRQLEQRREVHLPLRTVALIVMRRRADVVRALRGQSF